MDSSSEDFEDLNCIEEDDLDNLDISEDEPKKPHFLDYDSAPPDELHFSCYSSLPESSSKQSLRSNANDLDKNNTSEKSAVSQTLSQEPVQGPESHVPYTQPLKEIRGEGDSIQSVGERVLLTRRRSATEVPAPTAVNTGTRKKEFPTFNSQTYHSLDSESVPISRSSDKRPATTAANRHVSLERDRGSRPIPAGMSTSMTTYLGQESASPRSGGTWPDAHGKHNPARRTVHEMGPKVEWVYSLLSMLGSHDIKVTSAKFLELSKSPETCSTLRRSGCIPLFVQMIHSDSDELSRKNAAQALHNVVHCHPEDKVSRREKKVLQLIETVMFYCEYLKRGMLKSLGVALSPSEDDDVAAAGTSTGGAERDRHPILAISSLMKISFDEEHRHAMCQLGALQAIAHLVHLDHAVHGVKPSDSRCVSLRRYAGMALTNLTFGDGNNKALLCSNKEFMKALVAQLNSLADDLIQVTASVLRNLSWRADNNMITVLNEIGTVTALTHAAMKNNNMENTLKAILSALWNLSAHCSANKAEFCRVEGALAFLVEMLTFNAPSKTLTIVENAGGILRNVSSHIAVREDYRQILREYDCLGILLQQLRSESLTIVSNACGTLWNLSARCPTDQKYLWENGAVPMLRSLIHSKHKMISNGSNAALKNLLNYRPGNINHVPLDSVTKAMNLKELPSLSIRKQRALEQELDRKLSDTCEIIDMAMSPKKDKSPARNVFSSANGKSPRSKSVDSKAGMRRQDREEEEEVEDDAPVSMNVAPPAAMGEQRPQPEQEMDQITDYSLRYAENHADVDSAEEETDDKFNGNEIILILEDTVKCYQEEGTPYTISSATSMTDLRGRESTEKKVSAATEGPKQRKSLTQATNSGIQTPEKPVKYCEEGTPGCFSTEFSRIGSLSSLEGEENNAPGEAKERAEKEGEAVVEENKKEVEPGVGESPNGAQEIVQPEMIPLPVEDQQVKVDDDAKEPTLSTTLEDQPAATTLDKPEPSATSKNVSFIDYVQETPLMFSRTSSLESLSSAEPACVDDVSSVVSEFSRVASGVMSPSELPDSPTQSIPQSPSRRRRQGELALPPVQETSRRIPPGVRQAGVGQAAPQPQSVFEDKVDMFNVENTPAQFSCATSLSNLSILNDEPKGGGEGEGQGVANNAEDAAAAPDKPLANNAVVDESESDAELREGDDELLDTCVNLGLNRRNKSEFNPDFVQQYCTEDTPALLSKACSNSDLSVLSMLDNANACEVVHLDDSSSSPCGSDEDGLDERLLAQCIESGIEKTTSKAPKGDAAGLERRIVTGEEQQQKQQVVAPRNPGPRRDSLSSLSVDSADDDDNNILEEAIAAGLNRIRKPEFIVGASAAATMSRPLATGQGAAAGGGGNDSMSSLDSCESNEQSHLLLEQCIQSGINRRVNMHSTALQAPVVNASTGTGAAPPAAAMAPMRTQKSRASKISSSSAAANQQRPRIPARNVEYHRTDDEALLQECINLGIEKNLKRGGNSGIPRQTQPQFQGQQQQQSNGRYERENINSENILARQNQDIMRRIERMTLEEKYGGGGGGGGGDLSRARTMTSSKNANGASVATLKGSASAAGGGGSAAAASVGSAVTSSNSRPNCRDEGTGAPNGGKQGRRRPEEAAVVIGDCRRNGNQSPLDSSTTTIHRTPTSSCNTTSNSIPAGTTETLSVATGGQMAVGPAAAPGIINSINGFDDRHALGESNEFPAVKTASATGANLLLLERSDGGTGGEQQMGVSNEYMVESSRALTLSAGGGVENNKHKDPDLMLKSVDRLTHVLVTTAEYLRAHPHDVSAASTEMGVAPGMRISSYDEGTWNENTCPNGDVSFPSLSYSPPKIDDAMEMGVEGDDEVARPQDDGDDDTITASLSLNKVTEPAAVAIMRQSVTTNEIRVDQQSTGGGGGGGTAAKVAAMDDIMADMMIGLNDAAAGQNGLSLRSCDTVVEQLLTVHERTTAMMMDEPDTPVNVGDDGGIQFQIGGQVKASAVLDSSLHDPFKEYNYGGSITSLDLDNIQPPSEMEGISYMGKMDSPQLNSIRNRKGLPGTLVARRAIAGGHNLNVSLMKSVESVASNSNLENVAPPSLMDELLDSMISVDSITSEIASDPLKRTLCNGPTYGLGGGEMTNYETALSDGEDTMTLRSCRDLPLDGTASSSNCSSNQSTPVKRKTGRITPKMKRELAKDRYKTYTVKDGLLNAATGHQNHRDEEIQVVPQRVVEVEEEEEGGGDGDGHGNNTKSPKTSARQRRQENRSRFQTQILDYSEMKIFEIAPKEEENGYPMETDQANAEEERMMVEENNEKKKPTTVIKKTLMKLIKPATTISTESPSDTNKAIRGRRKPEYVSPYRRPTSSTNQTPKTSGSSTPKLTPKSTAGQTPKKATLISKLRMATTSKKILPKQAKVEETSPNKLDRQGTFTKDEPSNENLPKVASLPATPTRRISKVPLGGTGIRKSFAGTPTLNLNGTGGGGPVTASRNGVMKRQISAPAPTLGEKRKSMIVAPSSKASSGQLSERSASTASIKSSNSSIRTPTNKPVERKLPLSMPTSRSNSTMSTPRTPTATTPTTMAGKFSLYGRAKGLIPVTLSSAKK